MGRRDNSQAGEWTDVVNIIEKLVYLFISPVSINTIPSASLSGINDDDKEKFVMRRKRFSGKKNFLIANIQTKEDLRVVREHIRFYWTSLDS